MLSLYTCCQVYFISATYVSLCPHSFVFNTALGGLIYDTQIPAQVQFLEISSDACCNIALEMFLKKKKTSSFLNERSLFLGFINVVITVMHFPLPSRANWHIRCRSR